MQAGKTAKLAAAGEALSAKRHHGNQHVAGGGKEAERSSKQATIPQLKAARNEQRARDKVAALTTQIAAQNRKLAALRTQIAAAPAATAAAVEAATARASADVRTADAKAEDATRARSRAESAAQQVQAGRERERAAASAAADGLQAQLDQERAERAAAQTGKLEAVERAVKVQAALDQQIQLSDRLQTDLDKAIGDGAKAESKVVARMNRLQATHARQMEDLERRVRASI